MPFTARRGHLRRSRSRQLRRLEFSLAAQRRRRGARSLGWLAKQMVCSCRSIDPAGECCADYPAAWSQLEAAYLERKPYWPRLPSQVVSLPLTLGPRTLGAVAFELERAAELEPGDRALFEDLVRPLALALDRARL